MMLKDKAIVITGSTRGIGRAVAAACDNEGASVVICSRNENAVKQTCEDLKQQDLLASEWMVDQGGIGLVPWYRATGKIKITM